jgi:hypothetical protein
MMLDHVHNARHGSQAHVDQFSLRVAGEREAGHAGESCEPYAPRCAGSCQRAAGVQRDRFRGYNPSLRNASGNPPDLLLIGASGAAGVFLSVPTQPAVPRVGQ